MSVDEAVVERSDMDVGEIAGVSESVSAGVSVGVRVRESVGAGWSVSVSVSIGMSAGVRGSAIGRVYMILNAAVTAEVIQVLVLLPVCTLECK